MKQKPTNTFLTLMILFILTLTGVSSAAGQRTNAVESMPGQQVIIRYDPDAAPKPFTPPPANFMRTAVQTADIQVNYVGSWTTEAQTAFEYAVSIWESLIVSSVPIVVQAEFANLGPGILGGAGPWTFYRNVAGEPIPNTWYPVAIANALEGSDIDSTKPEINSQFNSAFDWYYGTDGNTPASQVDFVSVVLHEIGHGLGFAGSMRVNSGVGSWGYTDGTGSTFPTIYDRYTENGAGTSLILGFPNGSSTLAAQLTSNNIYFDGPNANAANGGRVPLYAPSTWQQGSSYSHLAESFNGTPNSLMTYSLGSGQAEHDPGPVTLGIFADLGWQVESADTSPTIDTLPTVLIQTGTSQDNAIDLWAYVSDPDHDPDQLAYTITGQSDPTAGATIDGNRYLDINPTDVNWVGSSIVTVTATDPDAQADTADFKVVSGEITDNYLPLVTR